MGTYYLEVGTGISVKDLYLLDRGPAGCGLPRTPLLRNPVNRPGGNRGETSGLGTTLADLSVGPHSPATRLPGSGSGPRHAGKVRGSTRLPAPSKGGTTFSQHQPQTNPQRTNTTCSSRDSSTSEFLARLSPTFIYGADDAFPSWSPLTLTPLHSDYQARCHGSNPISRAHPPWHLSKPQSTFIAVLLPNFVESPTRELRGIHLPRTRVNSGQQRC
jgi:hypothetical protein